MAPLLLSRSRLRVAAVATTLVLAGTGAGLAMRAGQATPSPGSYTVVGLGDSVQSGYHCNCTTYVSLVADRLAVAQRRTPVTRDEATPGFTTNDVLAQLSDPVVEQDVRSANLIVIEIGANDFDQESASADSCVGHIGTCFGTQLSSMKRNVSGIVQRVQLLNPRGRIVLLGYWNVFADGDVAREQGLTYRKVSDQLTRECNTDIRQVAAARGVEYVDVYAPFHARDVTSLLADDGDHPNAAGHRLLADAVVTAVEKENHS